MRSISYYLLTVILMTGCFPIEELTSTLGELTVESGDIVVSNSGSDVVLVLDSDGTYKGVLYDVPNNAESVYGLAWIDATQEIAIAVDGADRVVAVSADTLDSRNLFTNAQFAGNIRGLTQLISGDFLVIESNNTERFSLSGNRITTGSWPKALQTTGTGIHRLAGGGFVECSAGTKVVRTYNDAGTQTATRVSGITGNPGAQDCMEMIDGQIAVTWSGTNDTVQILASDLSAVNASYSDTSVLAAPTGIAQRPNGNLLVLDSTYHYIVELDNTGNYVGTLGDDVLNVPTYLLVIE